MTDHAEKIQAELDSYYDLITQGGSLDSESGLPATEKSDRETDAVQHPASDNYVAPDGHSR